MTEDTPRERGLRTDDVLAAIADRRHRLVVSTLEGRTSEVETRELATHVTATENDSDLLAVSETERDQTWLSLRHSVLPSLSDAGLVAWEPDSGTVSAGDHPALEDDRFRQMLAVETAEWDYVLRSILPTRRRLALSILESVDALDRRELAERVRDREAKLTADGVGRPTVDEVATTLHHVHLPTCRKAGLIVYDDETVRYAGHPDVDPAWFDLDPAVAFRKAGGRSAGADSIWTIEGREDVVARGQSLFERADDELFLMFTTDGLLEGGCLTRLEDAIERGVDVYLGSQSEAVRDLVRRRLPEVVIWEPQLDWLNLPPEHERVGRLVMADREAVMIGTLGEETENGYEEMAITGEGANNGVVVLLRQMLGGRLDHLDAQSEDFLEQLPL